MPALPSSPFFEPAPVSAYPLPLGGKPQEGLVVVAEGDAPGGSGGTFRQLIRGLEAPEVAPCAGPRHDLVGVSGLVPDGVGSVFLTSADGSAIKADVRDNGYAFLVAPAKGRELLAPRFVVWTGGDGTPHVQQVSPAIGGRLCEQVAKLRGVITRVSPPGPGAPGAAVVVRRVPTPFRAARAPKRP